MKLAVLGAGSWGLTLAWLLNENFDDIYVWGRKEDLTPEFLETKKKTYPIEVQLPQKAIITSDMKEAIKDAEIILMVVSTAGTRPVCELMKEAGLQKNQIVKLFFSSFHRKELFDNNRFVVALFVLLLVLFENY